ncbi:STAS/SEC14 domain-containing protein [Mariprofundus ferrooxydans]|uniref:STAS/SEC14 domain-containing protein n=1 Tax=Mariprofundus ferrooxydans TaxID=314344 RepID=UPI001430B846|nr:STAS/SEC14 domain-containing protein [Mariprofundus ferrooxydans]
MSITRHGLFIGIERVGSDFFMSLKAVGKLTHEDYEKITPMIDSALKGVTDAKVNMFLDASELEGWELRAAWDDFRLGLKHGSEFDRIAIFGNKKWQSYAAKMGSWFIAGEVKYFEDANAAIGWLQT